MNCTLYIYKLRYTALITRQGQKKRCIASLFLFYQKGCFYLEKINSIGIIGTGKSAAALLRHFKLSNVKISGLWGRNAEKTLNLGRIFEVNSFMSKRELIDASEIIILAVNDDSIHELSDRIASEIESEIANEIVKDQIDSDLLQGKTLSGKTFVHLSGALSSSEMDSLSELGSDVLSAHIIQSIAGVNANGNSYASDLNILDGVWFSLEGDMEAVTSFKELLDFCKNPSFVISKENKPVYHAAMCVISNYLVTLLNAGFKMIETTGLDIEQAFKVTLPLINGTLKNIEELGTIDALTGPIVRGDVLTLEKHLSAIKDSCPDVIALYCSMGMETLKLSKNENDKIKKILEQQKL